MGKDAVLVIDRDALRQRALLLVWIGEGWNISEALVALWSSDQDRQRGSPSFLAGQLDRNLCWVGADMAIG